MLRMDDLETLGVSTQTLAEEAVRAGRLDEAIALVDYYHQEMRIMHDILITWLTDIVRYIIAGSGGGEWAGPVSLKPAVMTAIALARALIEFSTACRTD